MSVIKRRLLIINFSGIGNGIWILPILKRLEEVASNYSYFHNENPIFDVKEFMDWLGLKNFLGAVSSNWRRFARENWDSIKNFLYENQIDLVINLRNEGPLRDQDYFAFKKEMANSSVEFWDLYTDFPRTTKSPSHLILDQVKLFTERGLDLSDFNHNWLLEYVISTGGKRLKDRQIGLFTGVSQGVKAWYASRWVELGILILEQTDYSLAVYAGCSEKELELAQFVIDRLKSSCASRRYTLVTGHKLNTLCFHMSGLDPLISNDTSAVHMAAALEIPTIGLYFSTDARIWGGFSERFHSVQSQFGLNCPYFKRDAGNCIFFYGGCPGPCKDEVTAQRVFHVLQKQMLKICDSAGLGIRTTSTLSHFAGS